MNNSIFKQMARDIKSDAAQSCNIEILEETETKISVWDNMDLIDREYTITAESEIDRAYYDSRLIFTPSISDLPFSLQRNKILDFLSILDAMLSMTLESIVFCNDEEKDFDYLRNLSDEFYSELEVNDLPGESNHLLGINWYTENKVFINVGEIYRSSQDLLANGDLLKSEFLDCVNWGIITTLVHELRHLEQSNPYVPKAEFQMSEAETNEDMEDDAENYAKNICAKHSVYVIS